MRRGCSTSASVGPAPTSVDRPSVATRPDIVVTTTWGRGCGRSQRNVRFGSAVSSRRTRLKLAREGPVLDKGKLLRLSRRRLQLTRRRRHKRAMIDKSLAGARRLGARHQNAENRPMVVSANGIRLTSPAILRRTEDRRLNRRYIVLGDPAADRSVEGYQGGLREEVSTRRCSMCSARGGTAGSPATRPPSAKQASQTTCRGDVVSAVQSWPAMDNPALIPA
jgi:hypothetical protein